jgi:hypothetical protein
MSEQQTLTTDDVAPIPEGDPDAAELVQEDDEPLAAHGDPDWIPLFVAWAREETDTLDFAGASVPERVRELLTSASLGGVTYAEEATDE